MGRTRISTCTARFASKPEAVWDAMTDNANWSWRSDLSRLEQRDETHFVEYPKKGKETAFTITEKRPCERYAFQMEHALFSGEWTGELSPAPEGGTTVVFTERLSIKNPLVWALSFLMMDLRGMQETYIRDLRHRLGERE